jgi:hypothetical protein
MIKEAYVSFEAAKLLKEFGIAMTMVNHIVQNIIIIQLTPLLK